MPAAATVSGTTTLVHADHHRHEIGRVAHHGHGSFDDTTSTQTVTFYEVSVNPD
jgi:hypothetical protein